MYQIDVPSAAQALPAPSNPGVPGFFTDGDLLGGVQPTILPAHFLNALMLELLSVLSAAGIAPQKAQYGQLAAAIKTISQAPGGNYAIDTGTANAYAAGFAPAITARTDGLTLKFRATTSNTGAVTFSPDGLASKPILGGAQAALQGGEIVAGGIVEVVWNALLDAWVLLGCTGGAQQVGLATNPKHAVQKSQLGAASYLGIGQGLEDDGAGGLRLKLADNSLRRTAAGVQASGQVAYFAGARAVVAADNRASFVSTAAGALAVPKATAVWNGFSFAVDAQVGDVVLTPNAADKIDNGPVGGTYLVPEGTSATFTSDGVGNLAVVGQTAIPGASPAPQYVNTTRSLPSGQFTVDSMAGPLTLTLPASPATGTSVRIIDGFGAFWTNNVTLAHGAGDKIEGNTQNLVLDMPNIDILLVFKNGNWSIQ
ncbi:hypothetical protein [Pseudoduganella sp. RAF53_2]|uniref:hypothetical protein n=1 Tax=unclassified Pseudoduganella TaxID=2637179 RepID=UPI003F968D0F